ncbi:hypothetical protein H5410_041747 [Solanum commersonii]|uniref:Uncharacterized protein n=1 Tax=Solanum commersonii TaxID=4109 RepID=A0A9J5XSR8_SOLCO|nr:hypothetical protein H5410_041747 [Solanum commersonii]
MEPVGPEGQTYAFSGLNEPQIHEFLTSVKTLVIEPVGPESKRTHFLVQSSPKQTSVETLVMEPNGPERKHAYFQAQTSPKAGKTKFYRFSCAIQNFSWTSVKTLVIESMISRGKRENFQVHTSPKTLVIELVGLEGQMGAFLSSNEPQVVKIRFYQFSCVIFHEFLVIRDSSLFLAEIFHDIR